MATKLAVLVIHGMGSQDPDFAHQSQASFQTGTDKLSVDRRQFLDE